MKYKDFEVIALSEEDNQEIVDCNVMCKRYRRLSILVSIALIYFLWNHRWGFAFVTWCLGAATETIIVYYHNKVSDIING